MKIRDCGHLLNWCREPHCRRSVCKNLCRGSNRAQPQIVLLPVEYVVFLACAKSRAARRGPGRPSPCPSHYQSADTRHVLHEHFSAEAQPQSWRSCAAIQHNRDEYFEALLVALRQDLEVVLLLDETAHSDLKTRHGCQFFTYLRVLFFFFCFFLIHVFLSQSHAHWLSSFRFPGASKQQKWC